MREFETKEELFKHLRENKEELIAEKKEEIKQADVIGFKTVVEAKSEEDKAQPEGVVTVKVVANSTNILDSHGDVHIKGNYDESIENKEGWNHLKDHERKSDSNIGIVKNITAEEIPYRDLGIDKDGTTECLVCESDVMKDLNQGIFYRYKSGLINQHSIGMKYRDLELAINDKESPKEKALYDQYIDQIANKDKAEAAGYFWIVKNIELIEVSAVMTGSNRFTPTLSSKSAPEGTPTNELLIKAKLIIAEANKNKRKRLIN